MTSTRPTAGPGHDPVRWGHANVTPAAEPRHPPLQCGRTWDRGLGEARGSAEPETPAASPAAADHSEAWEGASTGRRQLCPRRFSLSGSQARSWGCGTSSWGSAVTGRPGFDWICPTKGELWHHSHNHRLSQRHLSGVSCDIHPCPSGSLELVIFEKCLSIMEKSPERAWGVDCSPQS